MKLSELELRKNILVQGWNGVGKTTFIGTLCELVPTLVITSDVDGLETLASRGIDPDVIVLDDWVKCWDKFTEIQRLSKNYKAIAIDDFGATQAAARHKIEKTPRGYAEEKTGMSKLIPQITAELMRGERRLQMQDWGGMWIAMETFLYEVLSLSPVIKLVTVLESPEDDPRTGEMKLMPNLQGAIRYSLPARFSLVAEAFIAEHKDKYYYCLSSKSHPRVATKDRYGKGRTWVNPTMQNVLSYINKKGKEETDEEKAIGIGLS